MITKIGEATPRKTFKGNGKEKFSDMMIDRRFLRVDRNITRGDRREMSIFHMSIKVFSRSKGHSSIAAAAYRAGSKIHDDRTGLTHDYTRRDGVAAVRFFAPADAPPWASDAARLWNAAEASETRKNACVARELEVALPAELSNDQREALTVELSRLLVDRYRVAAMAAIHEPSADGDQRNHHAHLLFTTRRLGVDGFGEKSRELDDRKSGPAEVELLRAAVAALTNKHLERAGVTERVDHRRLAVQSREAEQRGDFLKAATLIQEPTRHEGKDITALRRRGAEPFGSTRNETIREANVAVWQQFVDRAQADGRLLDTPALSGRDQAAADRAREAGSSRTNGASVQMRPTASRTIRRAPTAAPPLDTGRNRVRLVRAEGKHAAVVNAQAEAAEQTLKTEADTARSYRAELEQALRQTALSMDHPIHTYAQLRRFTADDIEALAEHCRSDRRCTRLLREGVEAHQNWERAKSRPLRRRNAHGEAMARTQQAQHDYDEVETRPQPAVWKPKTRREWAELRRGQRARLEQAQQAERTAARATGEVAMRRYAAAEQQAHRSVRQMEAMRRERYPVPSDRRPTLRPRQLSRAKSNASPSVIPQPKPVPENHRRPRP